MQKSRLPKGNDSLNVQVTITNCMHMLSCVRYLECPPSFDLLKLWKPKLIAGIVTFINLELQSVNLLSFIAHAYRDALIQNVHEGKASMSAELANGLLVPSLSSCKTLTAHWPVKFFSLSFIQFSYDVCYCCLNFWNDYCECQNKANAAYYIQNSTCCKKSLEG